VQEVAMVVFCIICGVIYTCCYCICLRVDLAPARAAKEVDLEDEVALLARDLEAGAPPLARAAKNSWESIEDLLMAKYLFGC
jgi:hypothetical protein